MGDVSMGLAYLCGGCCCLKDTDPGPEGSQITRIIRETRTEGFIKLLLSNRRRKRRRYMRRSDRVFVSQWENIIVKSRLSD
ncbi:hypothetical protein LENED_012651 [Lentinula edodes]|uniref:Uncharacterized protein n=1 Tax=Lentinula edodes TaxID=5353 RepID=A0A1Q3ETG9_LENED|nr:hypothetical protein LENED_012651 [Lentinula edodes]